MRQGPPIQPYSIYKYIVTVNYRYTRSKKPDIATSLFFLSSVYLITRQINQLLLLLSKPKFNQNSIELNLRLRLHSYPMIHHHHHHTNSLLLLLLAAPASQAGRLYNYTVRVQSSHCVLRRSTLKFT